MEVLATQWKENYLRLQSLNKDKAFGKIVYRKKPQENRTKPYKRHTVFTDCIQ